MRVLAALFAVIIGWRVSANIYFWWRWKRR